MAENVGNLKKCKYCKKEETKSEYFDYCSSCEKKLPNYGIPRCLGGFNISTTFYLCPSVNLTSEIGDVNGLFYKDVFDRIREQVDAMEATVRSMVKDEYEWLGSGIEV